MRHEAFPMCCGGAVISDFGGTRTTGGRMGNRGDIDLEEFESDLKDKLYLTKGKAIVVATVNEDQKHYVGPVLVRNGFRAVHVEYFGGHRNELTLYVRNTPEGKKKYKNGERAIA